MHTNAYTTTIVHIRLDAGEQFTYEGRTAIGGNHAKAMIHTILLTLRDDTKPERVIVRGTGINAKTGKPLRVDREFNAKLELIPPFIVRMLFVRSRESEVMHSENQEGYALAGAWDFDISANT